jgi:N-acetylglucosamine kinase-like BadF-type ATPase
VVLAIDAGGTRTRCIAVARDGRVLGAGVAGPANVVQCGAAEVRCNLLEAVRSALACAGIPAGRVRAVAAGLAGVFPDGRNREPVERVLRAAFPRVRVAVTGDAVIALRGAIPEGHGVVALSGTGSCVFGISLDTQEWARVGGGGPLLGDEGSGYGVALAGLHAAWQSGDGRGEPTLLAPRLSRALGVDRIDDVVDVVYGKSFGRDRIAALAEVVADAAGEGDPSALHILRQAGYDLGLAVVAAIRKLGMKGRCPVSWQGALFAREGVFLDAFTDTVRAGWPEAGVRPPQLPPAGGAFLLALETLQERATGEAISALAAGLREHLGDARGGHRTP